MAEKVVIKEIEDGVDGAPPWITTFVDMVSLLVTFFILLFTFSAIREYDTFNVPKNIIGTRGMHETKGNAMQAPDDDLMLAMDIARGSATRHSRPVDQLSESLEDMGQRLTDDHQQLDLRSVGDGLRVEFDARGSFAPGSTEVNSFLRGALRELGETVRVYPLVVMVEGHTDAGFRPTSRYPDADALCVARARAAARVLVEEGGFDPAMVQVTSHGTTRPRSADQTSAVARRENRRVTVRLVAMSKERAARHAEAIGR